MTPTPGIPETVVEVAREAAPTIKSLAQQLLDYANNAASFAQEQAPLLAQEIIRWGIACGAIGVVYCLVLIYACYRIVRYTWTTRVEFEDRSEGEQVVVILGTIAVSLGGVVSTIILLASLLDLAKALIVPRLFLVERLLEMAE